ncbi:brinker DNA-binding domain-containing protein [Ditylenchus destructor]|uniref:Brinker DNA-binding domain-containing protein n=1 Tax=Ditylenchus destructor TaxID=166010 RepID=A0AAD4N8B2_9BILA|nr:brinker DNA-binding domain-containing protein [Ditylenchus destructor]
MNQFEGLFDDEEWLNQNMDLGLMEVDTENSTDSEAQVVSNGKKRNSYTIDYKLEAIDYAKKQSSINSASKHFNFDRKCIRKWMAQEEQLRKKRISTVRGDEKKELDGAGRPLLDPIFDKRLAAWVRETRATGTKVTLSQIVREAQRLQSNTELKAPDVCWNQPFKAAIQSYYNDWMLEANKEHTSAGNPRAASMEVYLEWVYKAWSAISPELIKKSFKVCGIIITATDGSEDDLIHCMKPEGSVPSARDLLRKARGSEVQLLIQEELDEEEDYNNGYESNAEIE